MQNIKVSHLKNQYGNLAYPNCMVGVVIAICERVVLPMIGVTVIVKYFLPKLPISKEGLDKFESGDLPILKELGITSGRIWLHNSSRLLVSLAKRSPELPLVFGF
jgi:hypothetical protein